MARITIFHWRDYKHPQLGGSTLSIVHTAEALVKKGHQVTFLTEKYSKDIPASEMHNGVKYIRKGSKMLQYLILPLYYLFNEKKNSDIVIEAYDAWPFLTPLLHRNVIMQISHIQKEEWVMEFGKTFGPILRKIAGWLLRTFYKNSHIVTISQSSKDSIITERIKSRSITVIPVGVEDLIYTDRIPEKPVDRIICCTPSRLKSHKQFDIAIELVANYNTKQRPANGKYVHFDIVGAGDHEPVLRQLTKELKMEEFVTFHGRASDEIKRELLSRAHLHLQFSKREGWGITVIEAAAQGAPTLCFDIPGLRDSVTEQTGYLVHTKDELFERFPEIVAEIENREQSYLDRVNKGFDYAQQFKWKNIDPQWEQAIERVLGQ